MGELSRWKEGYAVVHPTTPLALNITNKKVTKKATRSYDGYRSIEITLETTCQLQTHYKIR